MPTALRYIIIGLAAAGVAWCYEPSLWLMAVSFWLGMMFGLALSLGSFAIDHVLDRV
jgi:hypothetical protein